MTRDEVRVLMQGMAEGLRPLVDRVETLEGVASEKGLIRKNYDSPPGDHRFDWTPTKTYEAGSLVMHAGRLWHAAKSSTSALPGAAGGTVWRAAT